MKISGNIECEKCKSKIGWEYIVPQHISSRVIDVEMIDNRLAHPTKIEKKDDTTYIFKVRCKKCDAINLFEVKSKIHL